MKNSSTTTASFFFGALKTLDYLIRFKGKKSLQKEYDRILTWKRQASNFEYEVLSGKPRLVLFGKVKGELFKSNAWPFCGERTPTVKQRDTVFLTVRQAWLFLMNSHIRMELS